MAKIQTGKETPLMKQYKAIKARYPGALLLFRVGDFYETFGEDAIRTSKILDIVLTHRSNGAASEVELAGFPHHALDSYLPKLVRAGNRVAICDQLEDPKLVKGIVKRGVTELVTPGLTYNDHVLQQKNNNFLASVYARDSRVGVSFLDLSTGEFMVGQGEKDYIAKLIQGFGPNELLYCKPQKEQVVSWLDDEQMVFGLDDWVYADEYAMELLTVQFRTSGLKGFGVAPYKEAIIAAGSILHYLKETEHKEIGHITSLARIDEELHVWLDKFTIRNLELIYPQQESGKTLLEVLDLTVTPMGSRMMKKWVVLPLKQKSLIEKRLGRVKLLKEDKALRTTIRKHLEHIGDLERLISKVAVRRVNPRELLALKKSLMEVAPIKEALSHAEDPLLSEFTEALNTCPDLLDRLGNQLNDDAPMLLHKGGVIADGVSEELDELRKIAFSGKDYLLELRDGEIKQTGISSLKIAYNKVFGYYLEVSNVHKEKVPDSWIRKQTLVNAERYITEELKTYEEKILSAESQLQVIEAELFEQLVEFCARYITDVQTNAAILGQADCLCSFAQVAEANKYCQPEMDDDDVIDIKQGRHPVIEACLPFGEKYIPNNVVLNNDSQQIIIITGPNMAGKSALLRQTALIVLMAQVGSFVPAKSAHIGLVDKIFTRVGASDNLAQGESTFMVEMLETASILNNITSRSLLLMDEIGRGTSTFDGVAIAWAIVEHLHNNTQARPKTLFATHYHELNQLEEDFVRIKNFNVSVKEVGDKVIFLRKLQEGGSEHSFGIHVAQMAGMPNAVVLRANEIMHFLEKNRKKNEGTDRLKSLPTEQFQLSLFESDPRFKQAVALLDSININTISPVEALLKLNELQQLLKDKKES